jgi:hypothetical protein
MKYYILMGEAQLVALPMLRLTCPGLSITPSAVFSRKALRRKEKSIHGQATVS